MTDLIVHLPNSPRESALDYGDQNISPTGAAWAIHRPVPPTDLDTVLAEVRNLAANAAPPLVLEADDEAAAEQARYALAEGGIDNVVMVLRGGPVRPVDPGSGSREQRRALDRAVGEKIQSLRELFQAATGTAGEAALTDLYDLVSDTLASWGPAPAERDDDEDVPPIEDRPETEYGVSLYFADGTELDVDNIDGVRVYDKGTKTYPFGFLAEVTEGEVGEDDEVRHRAGYFTTEGEWKAFTADQQPNPYDSWGG